MSSRKERLSTYQKIVITLSVISLCLASIGTLSGINWDSFKTQLTEYEGLDASHQSLDVPLPVIVSDNAEYISPTEIRYQLTVSENHSDLINCVFLFFTSESGNRVVDNNNSRVIFLLTKTTAETFSITFSVLQFVNLDKVLAGVGMTYIIENVAYTQYHNARFSFEPPISEDTAEFHFESSLNNLIYIAVIFVPIFLLTVFFYLILENEKKQLKKKKKRVKKWFK